MNENAKLNSNLKIVNDPAIEYYAGIHINTADEKGKITPEAFGQKFNSSDILLNRCQAIEYLKSRITYFINEEPLLYFSSPFEAELKNYKNFMSFGIWLGITDNRGNYFETDGDKQTFPDFLSDEYDILNNYMRLETVSVEDNWGHRITVLKEDYDFFNIFLQNY